MVAGANRERLGDAARLDIERDGRRFDSRRGGFDFDDRQVGGVLGEPRSNGFGAHRLTSGMEI